MKVRVLRPAHFLSAIRCSQSPLASEGVSPILAGQNMPLPKDQAWFPVKTYGWGWGLPCRWQGWVVFIVILGLMTGASYRFGLGHRTEAFIASAAITIVLIVICWIKGERPRWRWGGRE